MDTRVNSESLVSFYLAHSLTSGAYILGCLQDLEEWKGKASIEYCRPSPQHHELCHMGDRVATSIHSHTRRDHQRITLSRDCWTIACAQGSSVLLLQMEDASQ